VDDDEVRTELSRGLCFSREDRDANIARIGVAAISPYREARDFNSYEPPLWAELVLHADRESLDTSVAQVLRCLEGLGLTNAVPPGVD
jgi:adenylylsulfate kinase-like enzyme